MKPSTDNPQEHPQELAAEAREVLERMRRKGIRSVYMNTDLPQEDTRAANTSTEDSAKVSAKAPAKAKAAKAAARTTASELTTSAPAGDAVAQLTALAEQVSVCTQCGLHEGRTRSVFGTGDSDATIMFIGEGPGRDEDQQGKPFVGRSGQLLTKMIAAIDRTRDEVYIANIVKCRPPNNRDPQEDEVRCCENYLKQQIALIKPKVICALGRVSAHWLLQTNEPLGKLRSGDNEYEGTPVLVTYHPAALLRNPNLKKDAWEDFKKLRDMAK